jgi:hypothetical protein
VKTATEAIVICAECYPRIKNVDPSLRPLIVCLCGSTRFGDAFRHANLRETLAGKIVLSIGCDFKSDDALGLTEHDKKRLDELHLSKIDLADEVLILNVGQYIGESTTRELEYARQQGKVVRFLESYAEGL